MPPEKSPLAPPSHVRARLRVAALAVTVLLTGCWGRDLDGYLESARGFLAKKDSPAAVVELMNALMVAPESPEVRFLLGTAMRDAGDPIGAEVELRKSIDYGYPAAKVMPEILAALLDQGAYAKVLKESEAPAVDDAKAQAAILAARGDALLASGQRPDAATAYTQALLSDPDNTRARVGEARVAALAGDTAKAQQVVSALLARDPSVTDAWLLQAALLSSKGDRDGARNAYEKAIDAAPYDVKAYAALIPILVQEGQMDEAARRFTAMKKAAPKAIPTAYADALISYHKGDKEHARTAIRRVLKAAPGDERARLLGGAVEHDFGSYALAIKLLEPVVAGNPKQAYARRLLASALLRSGKGADAQSVLAPLIDAANTDPGIALLAGQVALSNRAPEAALARAQGLLAKDEKNLQALLLAGRALLALGRVDEGLARLDAAAAAQPDQPAADLVAIEALLTQRKLDAARTRAAKLAERLPNNAESQHALGQVLRASGDAPGARAAFEKALGLSPGLTLAGRDLAGILINEGKAGEAVEVLRKLTARDPDRSENVLLLVAALVKANAPAADILATLDEGLKASPKAAELHLAKIDFLMTHGDAIGARDAGLVAESATPDDHRVVYALARAQTRAGEARQALLTYGRLQGLMPDSALPHMGRADAHAAQGNLPDAIAALKKALAMAPRDPVPRLSLVQTQLAAKDYAAARDGARELIRHHPKVSAGYLHEARAHVALKDADAADRILRTGLATTGDTMLLLALYDRLIGAGQKEAAEREAAAWFERHPKDVRTLLGIGEVWQRRSDYAQAVQWYRKAVAVSPSAPALNNLAWALGKTGDASALESARKALELAPNDPAILDTAGSLNVQFGDASEGVKQLEAAVARSPYDAAIRINLIRGLIKERRKLDATRQIQAAMPYARTDALHQELEKLQSSL